MSGRRMNINHWIAMIDGGNRFAEDIGRSESEEIMGRWVSGGEIQRSSGDEAARGLASRGGGFGGRQYSPHRLWEGNGKRTRPRDPIHRSTCG